VRLPSVPLSAMNHSRQSMKLVPWNGSPPIPTHKVWPSSTAVVCATASYVNVPDRDTMPFVIQYARIYRHSRDEYLSFPSYVCVLA